jgi:glycine cleavage system H protein
MLEVTVDKFIFRVQEGLYYNETGVWVTVEGSRARVGLSDFAQQLNGDMAFASVMPVGTQVKASESFGNIETVKAILDLPSPVTGRIVEINPDLENSPELINQDPYCKGWMALLELDRWEEEKSVLLDAPRYLELVKQRAEMEMKK